LNNQAGGLVAWVDDRHFYTENAGTGLAMKANLYAHMDLGDYRGGMGVGDNAN
jgi:hypothetical protein